jgi:hypothetical protein
MFLGLLSQSNFSLPCRFGDALIVCERGLKDNRGNVGLMTTAAKLAAQIGQRYVDPSMVFITNNRI